MAVTENTVTVTKVASSAGCFCSDRLPETTGGGVGRFLMKVEVSRSKAWTTMSQPLDVILA